MILSLVSAEYNGLLLIPEGIYRVTWSAAHPRRDVQRDMACGSSLKELHSDMACCSFLKECTEWRGLLLMPAGMYTEIWPAALPC